MVNSWLAVRPYFSAAAACRRRPLQAPLVWLVATWLPSLTSFTSARKCSARRWWPHPPSGAASCGATPTTSGKRAPSTTPSLGQSRCACISAPPISAAPAELLQFCEPGSPSRGSASDTFEHVRSTSPISSSFNTCVPLPTAVQRLRQEARACGVQAAAHAPSRGRRRRQEVKGSCCCNGQRRTDASVLGELVRNAPWRSRGPSLPRRLDRMWLSSFVFSVHSRRQPHTELSH